ncbi:MAG: glycoside hydrolase family 31 protein [Clostridiales bacterium]|jgi:alpha-glucosidase (family GH31 glycosyl hydrolase)|nr:glycoside hydrolase family 31 protein [Clostridiales bacterium]
MQLKKAYIPDIRTAAPNAENTVSGENYRITVIADRLFRIESDLDGRFLDEPSQSVFNRDTGRVAFSVISGGGGGGVTVKTDKAELEYYPKTGRYRVSLSDGGKTYKTTSGAIAAGNLKGTKRTLDNAFGPVKLGDGIMSKNGIARFDDVKALVLKSDGLLRPRDGSKRADEYIFAYGDDYQGALNAFYGLTGKNPLLPRFALGNWWSRYHVYSDTEYLELMKKFKDNGIPFSVATIDMDWHITDVDKQFGRGWTGYTWNKKLFPDPAAFLKRLKDDGYKITLNLHPADGCRAYEEYYDAIADYMGVDKAAKQPVEFDLTNPRFINAYFEFLHRPLEKMGVDFWWIDWQQGKKTAIDNLDPLWLLNHYHTLDSAAEGRRPLILSRYAGPGSHRYQIGFSGDAMISFKMLDFMPYFTSVASNIGFTWWSHDIGGHHFGKKNGELYLRWVELGVFSPILRLHSTSNQFIDKDPFKFRADIRDAAIRFLKLRHKLIPYIYTMNYLNHAEGVPLCRPLYYENKAEGFYKSKYRNAFLFGTELLVAPITRPAKKASKSEFSYSDALLPEGTYTDIFNGFEYEGGRAVRFYRKPDDIPALARQGAILPFDADANGTGNPVSLEIKVFAGADNEFVLYEDDGESFKFLKGAYLKTTMTLKGGKNDFEFVIKKPEGDVSILPVSRTYKVVLFNVTDAEICVEYGGVPHKIKTDRQAEGLTLSVDAASGCDIKISVKNAEYRRFDKDEAVFSAFDSFDGDVTKKAILYKKYKNTGKWPFGGVMKGIVKELESVRNLV